MKVVVTANRISFRTERGVRYAHVKGCKYLTKGKTAELLDSSLNQTYAKVIYGKFTGYVYSKKGKYLKSVTETGGLPPKIKALLDIVKSCVGGKYVLGGQGTKITEKYIRARQKEKPSYLTGGRFEFLLNVGKMADARGIWKFPDDYAWDCSGLFWYAVGNKLGYYGTVKDAKAHATYHTYCIPVKLTETRPGDCVFYRNAVGHITHMGIVGEDDVVYEAASGYTGVVINDSIKDRTIPKIVGSGNLKKSAWNVAGRPKCFVG